MKRIVVVLLVVVVLGALSGSMISQTKAPATKPQKAIDPVCGLTVEKSADLSVNYKGETYYFCSKKDLDTFKKTPDKYAKKPASGK